ncbi:MAG: energy-coupling factor transporter transmembrane component T [Desulfohalobiaceae bacterium]
MESVPLVPGGWKKNFPAGDDLVLNFLGPAKSALQRQLLGLDPRLKIVMAFALGIFTWQAAWMPLGLYLLGTMLLAWLLTGYGAVQGKNLQHLAGLVFIWSTVKALWGLGEAVPVQQALFSSLILGQRLVVLILLGLCLTAVCSSRQMGLALEWFLRPLLRGKSWQVALALTLMLHFLPLCLQTLRGVQTAQTLRCADQSAYSRYKHLVRATCRILAQRTWDQTLALAARGLDHSSAWRRPLPWNPGQWAAGLALLGLAGWMAWTW